jgi:hypothetical protein
MTPGACKRDAYLIFASMAARCGAFADRTVHCCHLANVAAIRTRRASADGPNVTSQELSVRRCSPGPDGPALRTCQVRQRIALACP